MATNKEEWVGEEIWGLESAVWWDFSFFFSKRRTAEQKKQKEQLRAAINQKFAESGEKERFEKAKNDSVIFS